MSDKDAIRQLRQLAWDLLHCECFQNAEGWTEDCCERWKCKFLVNDECEVQCRYMRLMDETNPEPDFDSWLRSGMPTDPEMAFGGGR